MAMISIPVPHEISEQLQCIDVPGDRDPSDHLTIAYLGDDVDLKTVLKCISRCHKVTEKQKPFIIELNSYSTFEGDGVFPIICPVENKELTKLHDKICKRLDGGKIEYSKKFKEYKPHVTLSYSKERPKDKSFPKICWQVNKIGIYGGDYGKQKLYAELQFGGGIEKSSYYLEDISNYFCKLAELK